MTALEGEIIDPQPRPAVDDIAVRPPGALATRDEWDAFTDGWLANRRLSPNTRAAYRRDVGVWLDWCRTRELDPMVASFLHINAYARDLETTRTPSTVARMLSGLSSWYRFLVKLSAIAVNPVTDADRPQVSRDHSATIGLTAAEVDQLLAAAEAARDPDKVRTLAMLTVLADLGLRVGELVGLDLADLSYERGHRAIRFVGKGGQQRRRALTPGSSMALDAYLEKRAAAAGLPVEQLTGPVFITTGGRTVDRHAMYKVIRRLAKRAGLPAADKLSPHSLRHAFATAARDEGVPLEDVQDAMGHADPRTTRRYDRDRHNLDRDPSYTIWAARARRRRAEPTADDSAGDETTEVSGGGDQPG